IDALSQRNWSNAIPPLRKLTELYPDQTGEDSAWELLTRVHRALTETNAERAALMKVASLEADSYDAFVRLCELAAVSADWDVAYENGRRALAVNPLLPQPHRYVAQAAEALGRDAEAMRASRTLLLLDPPDPAEVHF